jgi:hypothetical protein
MLDDELNEIIEAKNITCFWQLLDYLILCGYKKMDSLGICLKYFTEYNIWKDVAYGKFIHKERMEYNLTMGVDPAFENNYHRDNGGRIVGVVHRSPQVVIDTILEIGMIDENNKHLIGLFDFYKKSIVEGKLEFNQDSIKEIEDNCKIKYRIPVTGDFITQYFKETSIKHFGYDILNRQIRLETIDGVIGGHGFIEPIRR